MHITTVPDGLWYGSLIIVEIICIPYHILEDAMLRANKQYAQYKPGRKHTGLR